MAAASLVLALLGVNLLRGRRLEAELRLDSALAQTLAEWARRGPRAEEIAQLSRLGRADRAVLFAVCFRMLPELDASALAQVRDGLESSGLLTREVANLRHRNAGRRMLACRVLGRLGYAAAVPALIERLEDRDTLVRRQAIAALSDLGAVEALDPIVRALEANAGWGDLLAIMALSRMGPASVAPVGALLERSTSPAAIKGLLQVTAQTGVAADPALVRALARHESAEVRVAAVRTLGHLRPEPESVDVCLAAMNDAAWPTRALAARSLGRLGDVRAIPQLERAMGDTAYWVRHHAGEALTELGAAGQQALQRRLEDPNRFVRDMATQKLYTSAALATRASR